MAIADEGIRALSEHVDSLITIPNEKLLTALGKNTSLLQAFGEANNVLLGAVQGIADLITRPGMINVDFADVRTVMSEKGMAMMGTGTASGENRAIEATEKAIRSPLLEDIDLRDARGILVNISAGSDFSIGEFTAVGDLLDEFSSEHSTVVIGTSIDPEMDSNDEVKVTVVAAGLEQDRVRAEVPKPVAPVKPPVSTAPVDYTKLDRQPAMTRKGQDANASAVKKQAEGKTDMDYLDIPAFLRRQAD